MRSIAERFKPELYWLQQKAIKSRYALMFGGLSIALYSMLYLYSNELVHIAQDTHHGQKALFFVPIVVALVFSVIHGAFTSHFWEALNIKAKNHK